jgi:hypothetical protein
MLCEVEGVKMRKESQPLKARRMVAETMRKELKPFNFNLAFVLPDFIFT